MLYAYCCAPDRLSFPDFLQGMIDALRAKEVDSWDVGLYKVLKAVRSKSKSKSKLKSEYPDAHRPPVFLLIDEASKTGDANMFDLIKDINPQLGTDFYALWTSLTWDPFGGPCRIGGCRPFWPLHLRALPPEDVKGMIRARFQKELEELAPRLRKRDKGGGSTSSSSASRGGMCGPGSQCSVEELLDALVALAGGPTAYRGGVACEFARCAVG
jgi:hypothetical protein